MAAPLYTVTPQPIETILTWIKSGEIAIPEIQRPFVWEGSQVRNLLDSLYRGYPVGYLIAWKNPDVRLKDGRTSEGKRILIDGQQRVTALMASLLAHEVINKDYKQARIRIAFHPVLEKFEVSNSAIQKDPAWIQDVAAVFEAGARTSKLRRDYLSANADVDGDTVEDNLEKLKAITTNQVGIIDLASTLDIETVTEIFIRVNSAGVSLSQADFVMSKIAANETYGGNTLRKAIDYFCHLAQHPGFLSTIAKDEAFTGSEFYPKLKWMGGTADDIYEPSYVDMLRVAFTSEFGRGRLQDLVALLSGRNFETKQYEDSIAEQSFASLRRGIHNFINQTHFERFTMIIRSAGFISADLISSQNAINFAYILYLHGRGKGLAPDALERAVRRWYALSILTGRYSGSPESNFDRDIRQVMERGLSAYVDEIAAATLTDSFWSTLLPQQMDTSSANSPYFLAFQAAQVKANDRGFLSHAITVPDLLLNRTDVHHTYPADFLKKRGLSRGRYNQIANFVLAQSEINIAIGNKDPQVYFGQLREQVSGSSLIYGGITDRAELEANLAAHCIPASMLDDPTLHYDAFLEQRRRLMARKLQTWFGGL
ncbi:GmrSD restriction endonuclease domain-containing protein [Deinococcus gobiensis]|uniref:GmrSD restriction endonucleases N-terminal domain-containing protein n=1 Tax=Deinococcus gobiensis (strain DSM 21396 / JCM 16679 / CGMCC 1.7299 / I-0) TaxID=745776 RepID=H8GUM1_DEIGI|nr:DUF262 domain-containing protein [Deinococcus gobiensis]AFD26704.1 hypothetical protein DGo_CA2777 [Deinococcus gobiensis I-0]